MSRLMDVVVVKEFQGAPDHVTVRTYVAGEVLRIGDDFMPVDFSENVLSTGLVRYVGDFSYQGDAIGNAEMRSRQDHPGGVEIKSNTGVLEVKSG